MHISIQHKQYDKHVSYNHTYFKIICRKIKAMHILLGTRNHTYYNEGKQIFFTYLFSLRQISFSDLRLVRISMTGNFKASKSSLLNTSHT